MSKITLSSNASGTGTLTIASPNTSTDRTLTLPDSTGTMATNEAIAAAGYTTSSEVLTQFNASGSAPVYACRAWVNFNGTGTVAIRESGNVTSITDNGTGTYTINFTSAMVDVNYSPQLSRSGNGFIRSTTLAAASAQILTTFANSAGNIGGVAEDVAVITVAIFR